MVRLALALLLGCFPGLQESTDKQELRYRFAQGQKLEITVGQKMSLKLKEIPEEFAEMIGDEPLKLDFTGTISVTVTSRKENGTAILKGKFTKASATGTIFVEDVEFEYDAEKPEEMEEGEEGGGNPLGLDPGSMFRQLVTETLTFEVDPFGLMTQKEITEENQLPFQLSSLNGLMGALPKKKVGAGDSWKSNQEIGLPGIGTMKMNLKAENKIERFVKVEGQDCAEILTRFQVSNALGEDAEEDEGMFNMQTKMTGGGKGKATFSISAGKARNSLGHIEVNISATMANPQGDDDLQFKALLRMSQEFTIR